MIVFLLALLAQAERAQPCGDSLVSFSWPVENPAAMTFVCEDVIFREGFE